MSVKFVNFEWLGSNGKAVLQKKSTELLNDFVDFLGLGERDLTITFQSEFPASEMPNGQRFQVATADTRLVYLKMKAGANFPVLQVLFPQPENIVFGTEMDWGKYIFLGVRLFNSLTKVFNYRTGLVKFRRLYKIFSGANFRVAALDERIVSLVGHKSVVSAQMILYLKTGRNFYGNPQNLEGSVCFCWSEDFRLYMKYFGQCHEDYVTLPDITVSGAVTCGETAVDKAINRPPTIAPVDGLRQAYDAAREDFDTAEENFRICQEDLEKLTQDIKKTESERNELESLLSTKNIEVLSLKDERDQRESERSSLKDEVVRCRRRLSVACERLQSRDLEAARQAKLEEVLKLFKGEEDRLIELIQRK
jgi:hypothetical protein